MTDRGEVVCDRPKSGLPVQWREKCDDKPNGWDSDDEECVEPIDVLVPIG